MAGNLEATGRRDVELEHDRIGGQVPMVDLGGRPRHLARGPLAVRLKRD